jgi:methionyl-tRNA synthetase
MSKILVTIALPYANGPIHLGHLTEHIQADIWVRWQKLQGKECILICGDDAHGTAIMLSAEKRKITPEALIAEVKAEHEEDLAKFFIQFDNYYTTHSPENQELVDFIYQKLKENDDLEIKTIAQAYDEEAKMFLPDRYVKGTCPRCGAKDQHGDNCEICGSTYSSSDLIDPISILTGSVPIQKTSEHYFFKLDKYQTSLEKWVSSGALRPEVARKIGEWFQQGLKRWDISRDAPYFGFKIPGTKDKYFYVWLDAPVGYMASFKNWIVKNKNLVFDDFWEKETHELYHFIGKDIIYFHSLFWPAILESSGFRKPTGIFVHGYLTVNGQKMSKSKGTFITARDYWKKLDPEYLRYYFATKLNSSIDDFDFSFDDFCNRVNSDLVGKVVNIASRCASFINKNFSGKTSSTLDDEELFNKFCRAEKEIANCYQNLEYHEAMKIIMGLADLANQYIDQKKPWQLSKQNPSDPMVQKVTTMGINLFRVLILYLKPVVPRLADDAEKFLNVSLLTWNDLEKPLLNHQINLFTPLIQRVEREKMVFGNE